jgi:hypothetical protein
LNKNEKKNMIIYKFQAEKEEVVTWKMYKIYTRMMNSWRNLQNEKKIRTIWDEFNKCLRIEIENEWENMEMKRDRERATRFWIVKRESEWSVFGRNRSLGSIHFSAKYNPLPPMKWHMLFPNPFQNLCEYFPPFPLHVS